MVTGIRQVITRKNFVVNLGCGEFSLVNSRYLKSYWESMTFLSHKVEINLSYKVSDSGTQRDLMDSVQCNDLSIILG